MKIDNNKIEGLSVKVVQQDAIAFLMSSSETFDLIVVDLHGNTPEDWQGLYKPLLSRLSSKGSIVINNAILYEIPEWKNETGVQWFLDQLSSAWRIELYTYNLPGIAVVSRRSWLSKSMAVIKNVLGK